MFWYLCKGYICAWVRCRYIRAGPFVILTWMKCPLHIQTVEFSDCASADVSSSCQCQIYRGKMDSRFVRPFFFSFSFSFHLNQCLDTRWMRIESRRTDAQSRTWHPHTHMWNTNDKRFPLLVHSCDVAIQGNCVRNLATSIETKEEKTFIIQNNFFFNWWQWSFYGYRMSFKSQLVFFCNV